VARAVDVREAAALRFVLDVRGVDRDAALALFLRVVDLPAGQVAAAGAGGLHEDGGGGQGRLAVIDVSEVPTLT
jgi:hypothetical protein